MKRSAGFKSAGLAFASKVCFCTMLLAPAAMSAPGDLVIPRREKGTEEFMAPSIFPHWVHRIRYRCDACHDRLFKMESGANEITMDMINKGQACGTCHNGKRAFAVTFEGCDRCHRPPAE